MCFCNPNYELMYQQYKNLHPEDAAEETLEEWYVNREEGSGEESADKRTLIDLMKLKQEIPLRDANHCPR